MKIKHKITPLLAVLFAGAGLMVAAPAHATTFNPSDTSVQLFKWKWNDVAKECKDWLGPQGYGAVQISPPSAAKVATGWWDMYQPVNFGSLNSRMGNESDLQAMIDACHEAHVRVYADIVVNHVANTSGTASDGSTWDSGSGRYPQFSSNDIHHFNDGCGNGDNQIHDGTNGTTSDYDHNRNNVVGCQMGGLIDLKTDSSYVQGVIGDYLKKLASMGVDGFRFDAAKHMWPSDMQAFIGKLKAAYPKTKNNEDFWMTLEIIPDGTVDRGTYFSIGTVNEFKFSWALKDSFGSNNLTSIKSKIGSWGAWGGDYQLVQPQNATVFVNNWDTERGGSGGSLTKKSGKAYDLANIFMLAQGYGEAQVQSGFNFNNKDDDAPSASPYDGSGNAKINVDWDFIHRWADISNMVKFRSAARGQEQKNWQTGSSGQIAFSRGDVGFVALNADGNAWSKTFYTGLKAGTYCNVVHGLVGSNGKCTSDTVTVDGSGNANITVVANGGSSVSAVAIYTGQMEGGIDVTPPTVPGTPVSGTVTETTVDLSWAASTDNVGVTGYKVYRDGNLVGSPSSNNFTDTGLTATTTYSYTVSALDGAKNESAKSGAKSVTTQTKDVTPPTAPTNVTASNVTSNSATLSWTASTDNSGKIASYDINRNGVKVGSTAATTYTDNGLASGTTYSYTVAAYDPSGNKSPASSPETKVVTPIGNTATVYYKVPSGWSTVNIHYGVNGVWTTPPGVAMKAACAGWDSYPIDLGTASSVAVTFNNGAGTWDNNGTKNYSLGSGISAVSGGAVTTTDPCGGGDKEAPSVPAGLSSSDVTANSVTVSWAASTDNVKVTGYNVLRDGVKIGTATGTSYTDKTVAAKTTYAYTVQAFDAVPNTSAASAVLSVTTPDGGGCTSVNVSFTIANAATTFGQNLYVVGNQTNLGNWSPASGYALAIQGSGANVPWTGTVALPPATSVQYKYVKWNGSTAVWESNQSTSSGNRVITTPACGNTLNQNDGSFKK